MSADEEALWNVSVHHGRVMDVYFKSLTYGSQEMILLTVVHLDFQQLLFQLEMRSLAVQFRSAWETVQLDKTGMSVVIRVWCC